MSCSHKFRILWKAKLRRRGHKSPHYTPLWWATWKKTHKPSHAFSLECILILSFHLHIIVHIVSLSKLCGQNKAHICFPSHDFRIRLPHFTRLRFDMLRIREERRSAGLLNIQYSEAYFYFLPVNSKYILQNTILQQLDCVWNVMAHAQKPDFVFRRNGRVHLNRWRMSVQSTNGSRGVLHQR